MNNIDKITQRISADADQDIKTLQDETASACRNIEQKYRQIAQDEYSKIFSQGTNDAALQIKRLNGMAQLEAKKQLLQEKQDLIALAFEQALGKLRNLPDADYIDFLGFLAAKSANTGKETLIFSAEDKARCGDAVCQRANALLQEAGKPAGLTVSAVCRDMPGGFILSDDRVEINCSLDTLVNSYKNELTGEIANILFD